MISRSLKTLTIKMGSDEWLFKCTLYIAIWKAYCKRRDLKTGGGGFVVLPFPFNTLLPFCWRKYKFRFCFGTGTLLWRWKCSIGELERGKRDVKCILGKFLLTIFTSAFEIIAKVWEITKRVSIHGTLIVRLDLQHNLFWKANFKLGENKNCSLGLTLSSPHTHPQCEDYTDHP